MLEGEISEINLVERLVELWREQFTGAIRFESDGIIKIVYFKAGDILSASTNDRADSVDEILMRAGKVTREHVKQALAKRKENETLGDALLNLGFITRKELTWARRVQVVGVIRSITAWESGSFTIVADYLPKRDEGTLFPVPQVLVELIVTDQDRQRFERAMEGGTAVFSKNADFDEVFRKLGLNEQAEGIVTHIDGEKSVADVATASGGDTFNVYKLLHALATLRILSRVDSGAAGTQPATTEFALDDFAAAGVADAADMWDEPQPQPAPTFELDEAEAVREPTIEIQLPPETPAVTAASAWDEEEEEQPAPEVVTPSAQMPAWDIAPRQAAPIPVPVEPPADHDEQWGFDEAQIETARAAAVPVVAAAPATKAKPKPAPPAKGGRRYGLLIALILISIVAAGAYAGYKWWERRSEAALAASAVVPRPAKKTVPPPAPATVTAATDTTMTIVNADTAAPAPTTTTAAPPPAPVVAAADTAALPKVTPKPMVIPSTPPPADATRERYDAMAREFAANATGNFTVQIQILCEPANLGKAMNAGGNNVWFVPQTIGARSCYRVFWGRYNTRDEAQRALAQVPAELRDRSAAVKPVPKG